MTDTVDWSDSCAVAKALREAKYKLAAGASVASVRFKSGDVEREIRFSAPNMSELTQALREAEAECAAQDGGSARRFAIGSGYRPRYF